MERRGFIQGLAALFVPATITQRVSIEDIQKENDNFKKTKTYYDDYLENSNGADSYEDYIGCSGTYTPFTITNGSGKLSDIL